MLSNTTTESAGRQQNYAEITGGVAVSCAAVCCCPFAILDFLVFAVVKLPAGLWRKARRKSKQKKKKKEENVEENHTVIETTTAMMTTTLPPLTTELEAFGNMDDDDIWESFANTGFWRSHSKKDV
ncbi:hypothetical protein ZOSMA_87G00990 [Zostera marina]|uniref:Transmembrane protein n=1 Tax=Zostera marina TaxID=29655 RepID=A0A0K9NMP7_ZOSMR|nr:hypothetical protein ZOSMA_87G00990 [Zostera marina]